MKYTSTLKLILFSCFCAFLAVSCVKEGPMGPAGTDGKDGVDGQDGMNGVDGNITCLVCHASENMESIKAQFAMSAHNVGAIAVDYAGGRQACAQCHSHEGFVQYAEFGSVLGDITAPSAWKCNTCHGLHKTFESTDYALRLNEPIHPLFNPSITMDLGGNSNLCANCHQSRVPEPNIATPGETFRISSTHYGPHHGAQANVVAGMGFAEITGSVAYPEPGSSYHAEASCVGCHMGTYANGGGHSWKPNLDACIECHGTEMEDFNYGNTQEIIHDQLIVLRDKLIDLGVVAGNEEEGFHPVVGTYPMTQVQAFFNWTGLEEDRSLGAHNPKYVKALIANSIEALDAFE